jgi:hypothetical protein
MGDERKGGARGVRCELVGALRSIRRGHPWQNRNEVWATMSRDSRAASLKSRRATARAEANVVTPRSREAIPDDVWSTMSVAERKAHLRAKRNSLRSRTDASISLQLKMLPKDVWAAMDSRSRKAYLRKRKEDRAREKKRQPLEMLPAKVWAAMDVEAKAAFRAKRRKAANDARRARETPVAAAAAAAPPSMRAREHDEKSRPRPTSAAGDALWGRSARCDALF